MKEQLERVFDAPVFDVEEIGGVVSFTIFICGKERIEIPAGVSVKLVDVVDNRISASVGLDVLKGL